MIPKQILSELKRLASIDAQYHFVKMAEATCYRGCCKQYIKCGKSTFFIPLRQFLSKLPSDFEPKLGSHLLSSNFTTLSYPAGTVPRPISITRDNLLHFYKHLDKDLAFHYSSFPGSGGSCVYFEDPSTLTLDFLRTFITNARPAPFPLFSETPRIRIPLDNGSYITTMAAFMPGIRLRNPVRSIGTSLRLDGALPDGIVKKVVRYEPTQANIFPVDQATVKTFSMYINAYETQPWEVKTIF